MKPRFLLILAILSLVTAALVSCNGGGGGGGDDDDEPAEITQENFNDVVDFVTESIPGCDPVTAPASSSRTPLLLALGRVSAGVVDEIQRASAEVVARGHGRQIDPIIGNCGGTLTVDFTQDANTGNFSGSLNIDNFCQEVEGTQIRLGGSASFSGNVNENTGHLTLEASADGLTVQSDTLNVEINLDELSLEVAGDTITLALDDLEIKDNTENETFAIPSLSFTATEQADESTTITFTAKFVDPEQGSVNIRTVNQLVLRDDTLQSGSIRAEGANDTQILMTVTTDNTLQFQADTDGDGTLDDASAEARCVVSDLGLF